MSDQPPMRRGLDLRLLRDATGFVVRSTPQTMRQVLLALIPGAALYAYLIAWQVLLNVLLALLAALAFEAIALRLRSRNVMQGLSDGSALVTAALLALSVPPNLPAWQLVLGIGVAILLAKHVYGGLGHNPFNPAMVGLAVLLVSFPVTMTHWPVTADPVLSQLLPQAEAGWDGVTAQTPLDRWREQARGHAPETAPQTRPTTKLAPGSAWSLLAIAWFAGGIWLLWRRVISWHVPVSLLITLAVCHGLAGLVSSSAMPVSFAVVAGASVFGAFFIATDPVSGAATPRGRIMFGVGVAVITFCIRQFGSWPEGFAFAILIMNGAVPLIDRLDRPRP